MPAFIQEVVPAIVPVNTATPNVSLTGIGFETVEIGQIHLVSDGPLRETIILGSNDFTVTFDNRIDFDVPITLNEVATYLVALLDTSSPPKTIAILDAGVIASSQSQDFALSPNQVTLNDIVLDMTISLLGIPSSIVRRVKFSGPADFFQDVFQRPASNRIQLNPVSFGFIGSYSLRLYADTAETQQIGTTKAGVLVVVPPAVERMTISRITKNLLQPGEAATGVSVIGTKFTLDTISRIILRSASTTFTFTPQPSPFLPETPIPAGQFRLINDFQVFLGSFTLPTAGLYGIQFEKEDPPGTFVFLASRPFVLTVRDTKKPAVVFDPPAQDFGLQPIELSIEAQTTDPVTGLPTGIVDPTSKIYYTVNGKKPVIGPSSEFTAPFIISLPTVVFAIAVDVSGNVSDLKLGFFNIGGLRDRLPLDFEKLYENFIRADRTNELVKQVRIKYAAFLGEATVPGVSMVAQGYSAGKSTLLRDLRRAMEDVLHEVGLALHEALAPPILQFVNPQTLRVKPGREIFSGTNFPGNRGDITFAVTRRGEENVQITPDFADDTYGVFLAPSLVGHSYLDILVASTTSPPSRPFTHLAGTFDVVSGAIVESSIANVIDIIQRPVHAGWTDLGFIHPRTDIPVKDIHWREIEIAAQNAELPPEITGSITDDGVRPDDPPVSPPIAESPDIPRKFLQPSTVTDSIQADAEKEMTNRIGDTPRGPKSRNLTITVGVEGRGVQFKTITTTIPPSRVSIQGKVVGDATITLDANAQDIYVDSENRRGESRLSVSKVSGSVSYGSVGFTQNGAYGIVFSEEGSKGIQWEVVPFGFPYIEQAFDGDARWTTYAGRTETGRGQIGPDGRINSNIQPGSPANVSNEGNAAPVYFLSAPAGHGGVHHQSAVGLTCEQSIVPSSFGNTTVGEQTCTHPGGPPDESKVLAKSGQRSMAVLGLASGNFPPGVLSVNGKPVPIDFSASTISVSVQGGELTSRSGSVIQMVTTTNAGTQKNVSTTAQVGPIPSTYRRTETWNAFRLVDVSISISGYFAAQVPEDVTQTFQQTLVFDPQKTPAGAPPPTPPSYIQQVPAYLLGGNDPFRVPIVLVGTTGGTWIPISPTGDLQDQIEEIPVSPFESQGQWRLKIQPQVDSAWSVRLMKVGGGVYSEEDSRKYQDQANVVFTSSRTGNKVLRVAFHPTIEATGDVTAVRFQVFVNSAQAAEYQVNENGTPQVGTSPVTITGPDSTTIEVVASVEGRSGTLVNIRSAFTVDGSAPAIATSSPASGYAIGEPIKYSVIPPRFIVDPLQVSNIRTSLRAIVKAENAQDPTDFVQATFQVDFPPAQDAVTGWESSVIVQGARTVIPIDPLQTTVTVGGGGETITKTFSEATITVQDPQFVQVVARLLGTTNSLGVGEIHRVTDKEPNAIPPLPPLATPPEGEVVAGKDLNLLSPIRGYLFRENLSPRDFYAVIRAIDDEDAQNVREHQLILTLAADETVTAIDVLVRKNSEVVLLESLPTIVGPEGTVHTLATRDSDTIEILIRAVGVTGSQATLRETALPDETPFPSFAAPTDIAIYDEQGVQRFEDTAFVLGVFNVDSLAGIVGPLSALEYRKLSPGKAMKFKADATSTVNRTNTITREFRIQATVSPVLGAITFYYRNSRNPGSILPIQAGNDINHPIDPITGDGTIGNPFILAVDKPEQLEVFARPIFVNPGLAYVQTGYAYDPKLVTELYPVAPDTWNRAFSEGANVVVFPHPVPPGQTPNRPLTGEQIILASGGSLIGSGGPEPGQSKKIQLKAVGTGVDVAENVVTSIIWIRCYDPSVI